MRIISGNHKGRRLNPPTNLPVRPTTDFAKESLFNILNNHFDFEDLTVLDLFAGTGSISFEFASRGVKNVYAIDSHLGCTKFIKASIEKIGLTNMTVYSKDVFQYLRHSFDTFDVIFADPPYDMPNVADVHKHVFEKKLLKKGGMLIIEHSKAHNFNKLEGYHELRQYGSVHFSFFINE